jgi:hypothetical protein
LTGVIVAYSNATHARRGEPDGRLRNSLLAAVVILGLAVYCISFGPKGEGTEAIGWNVRFAALAALCAAVSALPRQTPLSVPTAVLAGMGFLEGLSGVIANENPGWALTAIVVLNALQAAAAVVTVLLGGRPAGGDIPAGYEAYVDYYNQAVHDYYSQQGRQPAPQSHFEGYGEGYADADAAPRVQRPQRASQHADYSDLEYGRPRRPTEQEQDSASQAPGRTAGLPSFGQAPTYAEPVRGDRGDAASPHSPG